MNALAGLVSIAICFILGLIAPVLLDNLQNCLEDLAYNSFRVDAYISETTNSSVTESLMNVFASIGISLLMLLFLVKGFQTYVLYTDGDAESDPINFLALFIKGLVIAVCGNTVLNWFAEIISDLSGKALTAVQSSLGTDYDWDGFVDYFSTWAEESLAEELTSFAIVVIFTIFFWIIYIKCLGYGFELWILKIAMPICSIGLINSDKGIFKSYVMSISKVMVTILVQITLTQLGFSILISGFHNNNLLSAAFLGTICLWTSLRSPKMLGDFMIPSQGGGNLMMKAYYGGNMIRSIKSVFRHFKK